MAHAPAFEIEMTGVQLGHDVVYADIGGLSGAHGNLESLAPIDALANALEPRCVIIKRLCMKRLASQLRLFSEIWAQRGETATGPSQ